MPHSTYLPNRIGTAVIEGIDGTIAAGSKCSFAIVYTAGFFGIDDSGSIKITERFATDGSHPQFADSNGDNYVYAEASNGAGLLVKYDTKNNIRPWDKTLYIKLAKGNLKEGERLVVHYSNMEMQTFVEHRHTMKLLVDAFATCDYVELPESPWYAVAPGEAAQLHAFLPMRAKPGEPFSLRVRADDGWGNPTGKMRDAISLTANLPVENLPMEVRFQPGSQIITVPYLRCPREGELFIEAVAENGSLSALSNPLVLSTRPDLQMCWGDLHGQSEETIGSNTVDDYFTFARDRGFLDICSHQGNDFQITAEIWAKVQQTTKAFYSPGSFVTFPGYEWSGNTSLGGDHNIYYKNEGETIHRSSHALIPDLSDKDTDRHTVNDLYATLAGKECFVYAHVGGRYADLQYPVDREIPYAVEIHSAWGTFEWLLFDAFSQGNRVGIVANSDGHKGRPGSSRPGRSTFGSLGGLTCFLVPELHRDAVFDSLLDRSHYATTGARIFMNIQVICDDVEPAGMGEERETGGDTAKVAVTVVSPSPVERVDIFNGTVLVDTHRPFSPADIGPRIKIIWKGAEYRGRGKQVVWDGTAELSGNRFEDIEPINFWNPEQQPGLINSNEVSWISTTTGGIAGIDARLAEAKIGALSIVTPLIKKTFEISDIDGLGISIEAGGLERTLHVYGLPEENDARKVAHEFTVSLERGRDNPLFARATTEDGNMAWASPIYLARR